MVFSTVVPLYVVLIEYSPSLRLMFMRAVPFASLVLV